MKLISTLIMAVSAVFLLGTGCVSNGTGSIPAESIKIPAPPPGSLKYTIAVDRFKNEAGWEAKTKIGDGFATVMTHALHESGWFTVLGDQISRQGALGEQNLTEAGRTAGGAKAPRAGRLTPAQLLVRGSITHVQDTGGKSGGIGFMGISVGGSGGKAEINITMYVIDTATGQIKASTKVVGTSKSKGMAFTYTGGALGGLTGGAGGTKKDNMGKATEDAVAKGILFLIKQLDSIVWQGTVISVHNDEILVNRGKSDGLFAGAKFDVGERKEVIDPDTGKVLDVQLKKVGVVEVLRLRDKIAYCKLSEGAGPVKKGMMFVPSGQ